MAIDVKEVSKFTSGLIGASSETDIGDDFATFSLDVDSEFERGALRGIKGNYILGESGWELPRYARWRLRFTGNLTLNYVGNGFLLYGYNKTFLIYYNLLDAPPTDVTAQAGLKNWTVININITGFSTTKQYADATITAINNLEPNTALKNASNINNYFTSFYTTNSDSDAFVVIRSLFVGDLPMPQSHSGDLVFGSYDLKLKATDTASYVIFPDKDAYSDVTTPSAWDDTKDGKFVRGNGLIPETNDEIMPYGFKFLKNISQKGKSNLFGITSASKAQLLKNIGTNDFSTKNFSIVSTSSDKFNITAEQRNKNLYIGTGDDVGTNSLWLGQVDRTQLDKTYVEEDVLESNNLKPLNVNSGDISVDNLVVPTLHYGLNSTNGGIAGSANIYANSVNGTDKITADIASTTAMRSVNGWAARCLQNSLGSAPSNYNNFKKGMIFRLDMGSAFTASSYDMSMLSADNGGESAFTHLRKLKSFAKGNLDKFDQQGPDVGIGANSGGSDGEELHSGDLFQIVYVPDDAGIDKSATEDDTDLIRFVYIGSLSSDYDLEANTGTANSNPFAHDNAKCYSGIPAYAFGHVNDDNYLYRIKTTSKNNGIIGNEVNAISLKDSTGNSIEQSYNLVEKLDLAELLDVPNFQISTIAECKSADGEGNFGGDTSNKNYYMGYGKLWVANKNEYNKLYLVDISNWDGIDNNSAKVKALTVQLDFGRIHNKLFSTDEDDYGKGLIQLWSGDEGIWDRNNLIGDYAWNNMDAEYGPTNYIASICETYSHKPHLGDGAGGGSAVGDGKWRVWVSYNKVNDTPHQRWDLFLFNFRPQAWEQYSGSNDSSSALSSSNPIVWMFDKTPPYQECAWVDIRSMGTAVRGKIFFPYDKFGLTDDPDGSDTLYLHNDGSEVDKKDGREWMSALPGKNRRRHGSAHNLINCINFRNPSGEYMIWEAMWESKYSDFDRRFYFHVGTNLGWSVDNPRLWTNFRHCLKPHFKEWYFTGITGNLSASELGNPVAHIVSFFGTQNGTFVKHGGVLVNQPDGDTIDNKNNWYHGYNADIENYNDSMTMYTMHDSPVAFSSVSGGSNAASFTGGALSEIQGAPNSDSGNVVVNGNSTDAAFNDTEAGWRTDNSVPATQGYSKFNQYRYNHSWNGTKELYTDEFSVNDRKGYGGAYYGGDEFGHYNMIATTWASNLEPIYHLKNGRHNRERIFGQGDDDYRKLDRSPTVANSDYPWKYITGGDDRTINITSQDSDYSDWTKVATTKYGTGYLTYRWPHNEDPGLAGDSGNPADFGDFGEEEAGFYSSTGTVSLPGTGTDPENSRWDNRKSVWCWSTTALTDSVYKDIDYTKPPYTTTNKFNSMISPRCSFRKIELPAGYDFEEINNVDFVTWQEVYDSTQKKHGYIISGKAKNSPIKDAEITSTIMAVIDNKALDKYRREGWGVNSSERSLLNWTRVMSTAATSAIIPLAKQTAEDQKSYYTQIVSYTNDNLIFKNLNPGISDNPYAYLGWTRGMQNNYEQTPISTYSTILDSYSPIIIGSDGYNNSERLSTWIRPQFTSNNTGSLNDMGHFPYYRHDRLWNYWARDSRSLNTGSIPLEEANIESGFDNAILIGNDSVKDNKRPTEGYGSTAGAIYVNTLDDYYPSTYNNAINDEAVTGAHTKLINRSLLINEGYEPADQNADGENIGVEFKQGQTYYYKLSFVYDGFQESPLSDHTYDIEDIAADAKYLKMKLRVPNATSLHINSRVTHINVYRKNNLKDLYRLVKSVALDQKDDLFIESDGVFEHRFNDEKTTISYEGLNGISETLKHLTPNYALSCQLNDFLFVAKVSHPKIDDGSHILLRSKQGKFSMFDWSNDFLDLPMQPKAMAAFANRIFLFDENNTYIINPEGMYIEEKTEGVGILNSQSVVVTDDGMFFADRNNIYAHNGRNAVPIGDAILYNHSRPEWQIGYLDAIKKAESLGYTPRVVYDSIKKSLYVILQGFSEVENSLSGSYENNKSRIYSFNINTKRWDYYNSPNINSAIVTNKGDVVLNDGYQLYNYRIDKRNRKAFSWESKEFVMGSSNYDKVFKRLYITGELCLLNFNNIDQTSLYEDSEESEDWGLPPNPASTEGTDFEVLNDEYQLNTSNASESDDLKVYVDGVLQTMRVQNRKPHIGHYLANDKTGSLYTMETELPTFETAINGLTDVDGNPIKNAFSLNKDSLPEFVDAPNSQYPSTTKQGELSELVHLHRGQYLYISGIIGGNEVKEIVKVKKVHLKWTQNDDGLNTIVDSNGVIVEVYRGLLGTKAQNWSGLNSEKRQIRIATPILKFPSGTKGKNCKIVFDNQKSYIDSFAITYRKTRMK